MVLFLPHFSLGSVQRRLQPPTSHQAREEFSLCCYTKDRVVIYINPLGWDMSLSSLVLYVFFQEKSPAAGLAFVLATPFMQKGPEVTEESAWTPASVTAFTSAKQNWLNLVYHMVGRIVSLEIESEPSLFHVAEITDTRFSTTFQHMDWWQKAQMSFHGK